jgi:hypothetical protein
MDSNVFFSHLPSTNAATPEAPVLGECASALGLNCLFSFHTWQRAREEINFEEKHLHGISSRGETSRVTQDAFYGYFKAFQKHASILH